MWSSRTLGKRLPSSMGYVKKYSKHLSRLSPVKKNVANMIALFLETQFSLPKTIILNYNSLIFTVCQDYSKIKCGSGFLYYKRERRSRPNSRSILVRRGRDDIFLVTNTCSIGVYCVYSGVFAYIYDEVLHGFALQGTKQHSLDFECTSSN
jgi:hypothetical protein